MPNPDDDALLPIGMFSRASSLSIKTLRAYHEAAILVPASVDRRTGYRAYHVDQLADAAVIVRLRALDVPLPQVRDILQRRDPAFTRGVLAAHRQTMQARLDETERIVAELQSGLAPLVHTPVYVRREPARHTLRLRGEVAGEQLAAFLGAAFSRLVAVAARSGVAPSGPAGARYRAEIEDDATEPVEAFVVVERPVAVPAGTVDVALGELPETDAAVLVHTGGYDTIGDTYRTLGAWVARHAVHAGEPIVEWYLVGPTDTAEPAGYRTEISWPIAGHAQPQGAGS